MLPLKKLSLVFAALLAITAKATPVLLEGSFAVNTTELGLVTGSFSKLLEVASTGAVEFDDVLLDSFTLSPSIIGSTTFDVSQVGADFWFNNGVFGGLLIGGIQDGVNFFSWASGGPLNPSDIFLLLSPDWVGFAYTVDGQTSEGFIFDLSYELKISTPPVPDRVATILLLAPLAVLAFLRQTRFRKA